MNISLEVIILSLLMFLSTTLMGWAPTWINSSTKVMNLISIFGAGMLVGSAVILVLPEAISCILEATHKEDDDEIVPESVAFSMGTAVVVGFTIMLILDESFKIIKMRSAVEEEEQNQRF